MTQKCGGRVLTEEEVHWNVLRALDLEEKKDLRRLGKEYEERKVDAVDNICGENGVPVPEMDAIVLKNKTSATNSLSQTEWLSMEAAMPAEERQTHRNLQIFFMERAKAAGVKEKEEEEEDDDDPEMLALIENGGDAPEGGDAAESDDEDPRDTARKKQEEEDKEAVGTVEKQKNWSSVNLAFQESKLNYRGSFSALSFTNWLWYRVVRPKLEETKSKMVELSDEELEKYGIPDVEEVLGEFMPAVKKKEEEKDKKDKKDKKDDKDKKDKKDKKEEDDKKDKKDKKDAKDKKKKKDAVQLNQKEKLQVQNLIKNMIYGESGKNKTITTGWVNLVDEKDIPRLTPWEFQLAHIMRTSMALEYSAKKKKEVPDLNLYYEMCQSLADAIGLIKKQYSFEFPQNSLEDVLPLQDALALQTRFREGSVAGAKFDLLWYLQNGAHLLAGSGFAKKHRTTVFKPFKIQELMIDAILQPGPQLVFGIAPPGTGKTAVVSHILSFGHIILCGSGTFFLSIRCLAIMWMPAIEEPPTDISMAITLKGSVITEAILHGYKDVENRSVHLPLGWIALHTGKGKCDLRLDAIMRKLAEKPLPSDSECPKGYVVGAAFVERSVRFPELRAEMECSQDCDSPAGDVQHVDGCTFSPHAGGPICNILSASLRLKTPVPCPGEMGCWRLPEAVREKVVAQLDAEDVMIFRKAEAERLPRPFPPTWAPALRREEVRWNRDMLPERGAAAALRKKTPESGKNAAPGAPAGVPAVTLSRFFRPKAKPGEAPAPEAPEVAEAARSASAPDAPSFDPGARDVIDVMDVIDSDDDPEIELISSETKARDFDGLVFCCPALPVVLSVGRISNTLGIPYAFCKGRRITPSYSCGRGLGTHVDMPAEPNKPAQSAVECLRYMVVKLNLERKKKRLAEKKRKRNLHDLKRFPRIFLMCDSASASWVLRQLDPNRTILVVDEPPMGSDVYPENPEDNPLACAMMQAMMTPMYKTILMSATLPRPSALPTLVNSFLDRFHIKPEERDLHVRECMSTELDRGAVMCGPSGAVAFPHQSVSGFSELKKLCLRLPADPLVLKAYTERALVGVPRWFRGRSFCSDPRVECFKV
ncbi:abfD [Symbiodinium sp. CCMP2592]|nr:abfD [Symbiodinium sp. CCMP2592]